jgi:hypothetical protein
MITGSIIAEIAALIGEPARATMLSALLDDRHSLGAVGRIATYATRSPGLKPSRS